MLLKFSGWYDMQHEQSREFIEEIPKEEIGVVWGNGEEFLGSLLYC